MLLYSPIIGVNPAYQKHGIGSRLVDAFLGLARKRGAVTARVLVTKGDEALQRFLERRSFDTSSMVQLHRRLDY